VGSAWNASAVPIPDKGRTMRSPEDVEEHPSGASPFGVMDLVGNVWQLTDEYVDDEHMLASCVAAATISRKARSGIFPRQTKTITMASCC
jgi:formylglycine-generating enzyme required for sulfatase activity